MSYAEEVTRARRLAILQALYFAPGYILNRAMLRTQVEATGYITSVDLLHTECAWLHEMGYVELLERGGGGAAAGYPSASPLRGELDTVRLTERGADVALGRSQTPGVRRPSPGEGVS